LEGLSELGWGDETVIVDYLTDGEFGVYFGSAVSVGVKEDYLSGV
jgi:hypothetical protein